MPATALTPLQPPEKSPPGVFPMAPMQQAMLYGTLQAPASGVNVEQLVVQLEVDLEVPALRQAVEQMAQSFAALRLSFRWDPVPVAFLEENVIVPFQEHPLDAADRAGARARFLRADRAQPFTLERAPLARCTLLTGGAQPELVWTFHHALLDGRSFAPVLAATFARYEAIRSGTLDVEEQRAVASRVCAPDQYPAYLQARAGLNHSHSREFWQEMFAGFEKPEALRIGGVEASVPCPGSAGPSMGERSSTLGTIEQKWPVLGAACTRAAERLGVTVHTLVQGAWSLLLSHYTRAEEVVFGSVRAGRHGGFAGSEALVGLLINTVPLRVPMPLEANCAEWLRDLRARHLALRPHEQTPGQLIQEWSGQPSGESLFESLLAFENRELDDELRQLDPAWRERSTELHENTGFPLTLNIIATEHLRVKLGYDGTRFSGESARGLVQHFHTLLRSLLQAEESSTLREIPMLPAEERARMLALNSATEQPLRESSLTRWFERQAAATPEAVALTCEGASLTYAELNARSNALARRLQEAGVGTGALVAICLHRSLQTVVALLGVLKAGAGYVPLEPNTPSERLAYMLADTGASVLLSEETLLRSLPPTKAQIWCLDGQWPRAKHDGTNLETAPEPDSTAYVIYTSGSTGHPKGVVVEHRHVVRLFTATEPWFHFDAEDVWTFFHSFAFDFSVWEIWGALLYGGRLVIVPHLLSRTPDAFFDLLVREQVTVLNQTPSAFRQLMAIDESKPATSLALRSVVFGGEALDPTSLRGWFARRGGTQPQLVNMYGITETTVHVTHRPLTAADAERPSSVIGEALPDLSLYVLDRFGEPCPSGVAGELYVGGAGVARGYLGQPELTQQRFLADRFSTTLGARLYRTGDLARYVGGELEYLGRLDSQVKLRGFRIELGEIESALQSHPAVREAVVLAPKAEAEVRLAAYFIARGDIPSPDELRTWLRRTLPEYMVPATFTPVERWPLTANGKLDRVRLPASITQPTASITQRSRTAQEAAIAQAWCDVLGLAEVDVDRNFFDSGGDSLRLLQVWARLKMGVAPGLPMVDLFAHPTVAGLARHLKSQSERPTANADATQSRRQAMQRNQRALRTRTLL